MNLMWTSDSREIGGGNEVAGRRSFVFRVKIVLVIPPSGSIPDTSRKTFVKPKIRRV